MKEVLLLAGPPDLRLFLRNTVFSVADPLNTRAENEVTMLSQYTVQKTSRVKFKKPAKSGMINGGKRFWGD